MVFFSRGRLRYAGRSVARAAGGLFGRRAVGYGVRTVGRVARSYTGSRTRTQTQQRSGVGVTTDRDFRRVYTKRRMPPAKRRRWKRFVRKVDAAIEKKKGTMSVCFNTVKEEAVPEGLQRMYGITLFGYRGTTVVGPDSYDRDMFEIANMVKPGDPSGTIETWNRKIHFRSGVLDITFRNVSINAVELDLYEYIVKKNVPFSRLIDLINNSQTDPANLTANQGQTLTHDDVGVTPFQMPTALSYITILKKTKLFIPSSGTGTYQLRKPRNRWWTTSEVDEHANHYAKRGWTCGLWIVQKGVPGIGAAAAPVRALSSDVVASITRTYTLKTIDTQEIDTSTFVPT